MRGQPGVVWRGQPRVYIMLHVHWQPRCCRDQGHSIGAANQVDTAFEGARGRLHARLHVDLLALGGHGRGDWWGGCALKGLARGRNANAIRRGWQPWNFVLS